MTTTIFLILLIMKLGGWGLPATWSWWIIFSPVIAYVSFIILVNAYFKWLSKDARLFRRIAKKNRKPLF